MMFYVKVSLHGEAYSVNACSYLIDGAESFSSKSLNIIPRLRFQPAGLTGRRVERNG